MQRSDMWTPEEIEYLKENWGVKSRTAIARNLGRSKNAVSSKSWELNLGYQTDNTDGIPITLLPELIGVKHRNIHKTWIQDLGMKTKKLGKGISYVREQDLANFMKAHRSLWIASKCDKKFFQRYDWFIQALEDEKNHKIVKGQQKEWTQEDWDDVKKQLEEGK